MSILSRIRSASKNRSAKKKIRSYEQKYRSESKIRSPSVNVEATFDEFVLKFGGIKISDIIDEKSRMPRNADYLFPEYNFVAELKTLEGVFSGEVGQRQLSQAFIDAGEPLASLMGFLFSGMDMPEKVGELIQKRLRRGLESRVKEARQQIRHSKKMFGDRETRTLILFAMDRQPIFGHHTILFQLSRLISSNYCDEYTDGVVYFNPNVPTQPNPDGMEFTGWFPFYRDDETNAKLSPFVDLLGNRWLTHIGSINGITNPILQLETFDELVTALGGSK